MPYNEMTHSNIEKSASDAPTLLSFIHQLGEVQVTLASVDGCFYESADSCLKRLTLGNYVATNYLEPWTYTNKVMSALYTPDQYQYLKSGVDALEFSSPYRIDTETSPLIDIRGGFDSYLSRLANKKRNEVRKLKKDSDGFKVVKTCSSKNESDLPCIYKFLSDLYDKTVSHNKSLDTIDRLLQNYHTELYSTLFCFNLLFRNKNYYAPTDYEIFILSLMDASGDSVCDTLCLSAYDDYVLHLFIDTNKSESYTAKTATVNQMLWAIDNGFSFIDVSNEPILSTKTGYKKLFYTGTEKIPSFYTDEFGYSTYQQNLSYDGSAYSKPNDISKLEDILTESYYGVSKGTIESKLGASSLQTCVTVPEAQGVLYFISEDTDFYKKPTPQLLWHIFPFYSRFKSGDMISHNLRLTEKGIAQGVVTLYNKTDEQILDWVRSIKTKTTYTIGSRYQELDFSIGRVPIADVSEFNTFLNSKSSYIIPKCKKHGTEVKTFLSEEEILYRIFQKHSIPITSIITLECFTKDTKDMVCYGHGYVSENILYATFMFVTENEFLRKRYSPALVFHSALPRIVKRTYPEILKVNFSEIFAYKNIFNFELEYGFGLEFVEDL